MNTDPLSDVIALSDARCTVTRCMETRGDWHFRFDAPGIIKFIAVRRGDCWLLRDGDRPIALRDGDVFVLLGNHAFALASDPALAPANATGKFRQTAPRGGENPYTFQAVCGHVALHPQRGRMLADALPPVVVVRGNTHEASAMRWLLDQLIVEINVDKPGSAIASEELAQLLFVHVIRACVASNGPMPIGWARAMADAHIAGAIRLIHSYPSQRWRIASLASEVGLSRTNFAVRFLAVVGIPPISYLATWRMRLAERALRTATTSVTQIAESVGFTTISGFCSAFKRTFGSTPASYRRKFSGRTQSNDGLNNDPPK